MIKVEKITIREFRGIRDLTIDFGGKNFAICGPNGTGKSGVVDALEFALTGNISRLSGRGTGGLSLKEHAPHVDSRNRPDKSRVILTVSIPSLKKEVTIDRSVKDPLAPVIKPKNPDILAILEQVALHPEFALSRRELIRYVISAPGDRAREVQALLRLDEVEDVRTILQKIANACQRDLAPLKRVRDQAKELLLRALDIPDLSAEKLLAAVNSRRLILGLGPIEKLAPTTSLRDGLAVTGPAARVPRIPKVQATADLKKLREAIAAVAAADTVSDCADVTKQLAALAKDKNVIAGVAKERFLQSAITFIENETCPVCDTPWKVTELKARIGKKLEQFQEAARKRTAAEKALEPLLQRLRDLRDALPVVERYGRNLMPAIDIKPIQDLSEAVTAKCRDIEALLPLSATIAAVEALSNIPRKATNEITKIETVIAAIPEPTEQDAARDFLTVSQERLETYRNASLGIKRAEDHAALTRTIYNAYAKVSTAILENIYKDVEKHFSELYRFINREDEGEFTARLTPSFGKLGFDVDFYGRGFFPPGAYHSEGHQDGMGVCLYLALMKHLLGDMFTFAVLDDVLMSVDTGHRREVCALLKEQFPNTQFILTTHDDIWLRHMKAVGLIPQQAFMHFRKWNVDHGPTEWDERDIWQEIADDLTNNDVRGAAALLRYYLEYISAEICHHIRGRVEFRGDAQFQLGDLLPVAIGRFRELLKQGKDSSASWKRETEVNAITAREKEFASRVAAANVEQWQINPAIHYNEWANLQPRDFSPVVDSFRRLLESFMCPKPECGGLLYVVPERGQTETLKCRCGSVNINLCRKA